jgi:hypothetical protein
MYVGILNGYCCLAPKEYSFVTSSQAPLTIPLVEDIEDLQNGIAVDGDCQILGGLLQYGGDGKELPMVTSTLDPTAHFGCRLCSCKITDGNNNVSIAEAKRYQVNLSFLLCLLSNRKNLTFTQGTNKGPDSKHPFGSRFTSGIRHQHRDQSFYSEWDSR